MNKLLSRDKFECLNLNEVFDSRSIILIQKYMIGVVLNQILKMKKAIF